MSQGYLEVGVHINEVPMLKLDLPNGRVQQTHVATDFPILAFSRLKVTIDSLLLLLKERELCLDLRVGSIFFKLQIAWHLKREQERKKEMLRELGRKIEKDNFDQCQVKMKVKIRVSGR